MAKGTRKTRFVCVSDTHNATANGSFKLPKGDVLVHAGDLTNQGTFSELAKAIEWVEDADFEAKIVVGGNHDVTLDTAFYNQYGPYFHNQEPQDPAKCQELLASSSSILYLKHETAVVKLSADNGPKTTFKVFGSPYSPVMGMWAFGYTSEEATQLWDKIPLDSDVVITHTPPKLHRDERSDRRAVGCDALRCMLWRVRPRLAICGHVHEGRGAEIIKWDLGMPNIKYKEAAVREWIDPGKNNKKTSLLDLRATGPMALANDGSHDGGNCETLNNHGSVNDDTIAFVENGKAQPAAVSFPESETVGPPAITSFDSRPSIRNGFSHAASSFLAVPTGSLASATLGQGGSPPSSHCDLAALSGRLGREETCVVNAAMMASSYPHKWTGGKTFNKPIVVVLDLPIWDEE